MINNRISELNNAPRARAALETWLERWPWTHFVSLATNDPGMSVDGMRRLIREWDARMNRRLNGSKWQEHPDTRLWAVYFLERPASNPHWHALVWLDHPDLEKRRWHFQEFAGIAQTVWEKLIPAGAIRYVAKELVGRLQYEQFVVPSELR